MTVELTTANAENRDSNMTTDYSKTSEAPQINIRGARAMAWAAYILLNVLYILACMQRTAIPGAIFDGIQGGMGLLGSQVTGLGSAYVISYATSQLFAGMLIDRFGAKRMSILGGTLLGLGLAWFSVTRSLPALYASRVISAFGQAFLYLCVVKISHQLFPPRVFGALVGGSIGIGFVGGIFGTLPTARAAAAVGWRCLFLVVGAACVVTAVAFALALRPLHDRRHKSGDVSWRTLVNLLNERGRYCFMAYSFWTFPAFFVLQTIIGQKFIQDYLGYPPSYASAFPMLLTLASVATCFVGAPLVRLCGERRMPVLWLSQALPVAGIFAMIAGIWLSWPAWVFLASFTALSAYNLGSASYSSLLRELTDTRTIAFGAAVRNFAPYCGSAIVGWICGGMLDHYAPSAAGGVVHYPEAAYLRILCVIAVLGLVGLLHLLGIPETRGRHIYTPPAI